MKRLIVLVALVAILTGLLLSGDSLATTADTGVPDNEITRTLNQTDSPPFCKCYHYDNHDNSTFA